MSGTVALLSREESLGYQVNHLARLLEQALWERIEPLGVVPGQFAQMLTLYEQDGLTQAELCERVQIEQPTMANTLRRMERDDLVERTPDPADGRRSLVMLTDRARELEDDLVSAARTVNVTATDGLDERSVTALMTTLAAVIANLSGSNPHSDQAQHRGTPPTGSRQP